MLKRQIEKLSIVVPIYNSEKYLARCINSLVNQSYKNLEIILVNDGSKDTSLEICKEYKEKDSRVYLIDKKNSGVSDSRNVGVKNSTGFYIMFVDSDDFLDKNYVENMFETMKTNCADVVISGYTQIIKNNLFSKCSIYQNNLNEEFELSLEEVISNSLYTFEFNPCWKQILKKDIITNNKLFFNENLKFGEDFLFNYYYYKNCKKIIYRKEYGYYYNVIDNNATNNCSLESIIKKYEDNLYIAEIVQNEKSFNNAGLEKVLNVYVYNTFLLYKNARNMREFKSNYKKFYDMYEKYLKKYNFFEIYNKKNLKSIIQIFLLKYNLLVIYFLIRKIYNRE